MTRQVTKKRVCSKKKKTKESRFFIEREFFCSTDACHVVTKISVPKSFDCAKPFICGFCAFHQQKEPKSFSIVFWIT